MKIRHLILGGLVGLLIPLGFALFNMWSRVQAQSASPLNRSQLWANEMELAGPYILLGSLVGFLAGLAGAGVSVALKRKAALVPMEDIGAGTAMQGAFFGSLVVWGAFLLLLFLVHP